MEWGRWSGWRLWALNWPTMGLKNLAEVRVRVRVSSIVLLHVAGFETRNYFSPLTPPALEVDQR